MMSHENTKRITVVVGQFGALIGRGLIETLRDDKSLRVISSDLDCAGLERIIARWAPQVVILDEVGMVVPTVLKRLRIAQPGISVLVLVYRPTRAFSARVLASQAICLPKEVSATELLTAVRLAALEQSNFADVTSLTARETEVLECLRLGQSYPEIALALCISVETVRTHAARIRRKLGVKNRWELIGMPTPKLSPHEGSTASPFQG